MSNHPVQFQVQAAAKLDPIHLVIRLVLYVSLAVAGVSGVYWMLYLAIPAVAALLISQKGGDEYVKTTTQQLVRPLRWIAAAYAYLWMLTDRFPTDDANNPVELTIDPGPAPTVQSALLRLVFTLPAMLVLFVLSIAAGIMWLISAVFLAINETVPPGLRDFLETTLRYQVRALAYHLSLVDRYPSFTARENKSLPSGSAPI